MRPCHQSMRHTPIGASSVSSAVGSAQSQLYAYAHSPASPWKRRKVSCGLPALQGESRLAALATVRTNADKPRMHAAQMPSRTHAAQCRATLQEHAAGHADPVVSTDWLAEHLEDVAILDVRGRVQTELRSENAEGCRLEMSEYFADYDLYLEGHIPGATFFDWTKDGVNEDEEVPVQLQTDPDLFAAAMEAKGVGTDRPVVVYDSGNGLLAPRVWWSLVYHGHPAPLVLDGGYARWVQEGRATDLTEPCPLTVYATFEPKSQPHRRATSQDMLQAIDDQQDGKQLIILDARNEVQYTGQVKRAERGGHIPGAVNVSRKSLMDTSTGLLRPLPDQKLVFEKAGVDMGNGQQIYTYCNGGVASCSLALALHRLGLGDRTANYDGSWNEWGNELSLPVQKGK